MFGKCQGRGPMSIYLGKMWPVLIGEAGAVMSQGDWPRVSPWESLSS